MGQWERASYCLNQKKEILGEIAAKTEVQCRFIHERKMTGLNRVLREKAALIEELTAINAELANDQTWKSLPRLKAMMQENTKKQQEIMERSRQVLQEAVAERARIAAELKNSKVQRQVKNQYVTPWAIMLPGCRFNKKG